MTRVSLLADGQNPTSLEYQIHPPTIDTLVSGMLLVGSEKIEDNKD